MSLFPYSNTSCSRGSVFNHEGTDCIEGPQHTRSNSPSPAFSFSQQSLIVDILIKNIRRSVGWKQGFENETPRREVSEVTIREKQIQ